MSLDSPQKVRLIRDSVVDELVTAPGRKRVELLVNRVFHRGLECWVNVPRDYGRHPVAH